MATDLLKAYANERVDLVDFEFLSDSGFQESLRQPNAQFLTDPLGQRSWVLDGFDITAIPATKQVQVDLGRAILGQREGALVHYGALTIEGDANKIIDMGPLTPNTGYGLYVRFEYVDGDTSSRIFWNPAGTGSEIAQSVATRRQANWSMRIELTSPGGEWLRIATLDNTITPVGVTDERPLYFEGEVHNSYQSGWSSEGGGIANDRNANRQQYGVKDMQTFTAAMRQCLEDIKGRGLRRWWEKGIGGINVGFDDDPIEDHLAVVDDDFYLYNDGTNPFIYFDPNDYFRFSRASDELELYIASSLAFRGESTGIRAKGIAVSGNTGEAAVEDQIICGDDAFRMEYDDATTDSYLRFSGTQTYFHWDDSADELFLSVASGTPMKAIINGVLVRGLVVDSSLAVAMELNSIRVGDADFKLHWDGTDPALFFDDQDAITYDRSARDYLFTIDSVTEMQLSTDGLRVLHGLYVGSTGTSATDDEIRCDGDLHVGGRQLYFGVGSNDYIDFDDTADAYTFYIDGALAYTLSDAGANFGSNYLYTTGNIGRDSNDFISWTDNTSMGLFVNGIARFSVTTSGCKVREGLRVGDTSGTVYDKDIVLPSGGIAVGTDIDPGNGYIRVANGVSIGWSTDGYANDLLVYGGIAIGHNNDPNDDEISVGDAYFTMRSASSTVKRLEWDALNDDYFAFDRSPNTLGLYIGDALSHLWENDKAFMTGITGSTSGLLTSGGEYSYAQETGMLIVHGPAHSGDANYQKVRALTTLVEREGYLNEVLSGVDFNTRIIDVIFNADQSTNKVFRVTHYGTVREQNEIGQFNFGITVRDAATSPSSFGESESRTPQAGPLATPDDYYIVATIHVRGSGSSVRVSGAFHIMYTQKSPLSTVVNEMTVKTQLFDLSSGRLQIYAYVGSQNGGSFKYHALCASIEEMGGETN